MLDNYRPADLAPARRSNTDTTQTIAELLARAERPTFSVEFFPPKTDEGARVLHEAIEKLEPWNPDFVSVTYGANGSLRDRTLAAVRDMVASTKLRVVGHLTCTGQSGDELKSVIDAYGDLGVHHILAVRGDMPGGPRQPWEPHPQGLKNATELVELVKSRGDYCVGVGAFPDIHPGSTPEQDVRVLHDKQDAGAEFAITQLFFRPSAYYDLIDRMRADGCTLPVIAGMMPVTAISQLDKFAELSGVPLPASVTERLMAVANDPLAVRATGAQICAELASDLLERGAPGLQFFTRNRSAATREILAILLARRPW
ncbi:methylenetetrahydrofolate reductase [Propionibacterium freudenreichii]|uniref:methylenetetrahydrofolate reductase n=1 Tax=Propionibacterium freudenreichii TaxID=1744 RepID=UPI0005A5CBE0|nr:methylenetetrahydrofolate reductase [Propionibacterium freudenreichii]MDK9348884.1 methylenetetrahydrofolate reductase [Propionibacterium freudenreichii]MDK9626706.1 methylenetetrahydrofolate reductase [Propionibacterium freudenreichii]MDK9652846.1 methylenetetrahydrofolate reductase [Propionibacterium freudenreichii]CEI32057.1 5,10-methylenetetrahydrofolate reductase [Propionibacterium freudenreichii]SBN40456.1 Methylenetetrahydrofolate reductase (NAD(P)H) [Propionibacterium freudenreichii